MFLENRKKTIPGYDSAGGIRETANNLRRALAQELNLRQPKVDIKVKGRTRRNGG